jgi:hypothetical protein
VAARLIPERAVPHRSAAATIVRVPKRKGARLAYSLLEDMVNYRLYETGPLLNGMRQGSGLSPPAVKPDF